MFRTVVRGDTSVREYLALSGKILAAVATAWAVGASIFIVSSQLALGPIGVAWICLFCGLYLLALRFAWRANSAALAGVALAAVALSVITGFSIGIAYLPGALALALSAVVLATSRVLQIR
jgi:hypothetical protein